MKMNVAAFTLYRVEEISMSTRNDNVVSGAVMLMAGGVIGAGVALLFAPQSGKRTRRDLARISRKVKDQAVDAVEEFSETVSEMVDSVSDKAAVLLDKGKDMAHSAKMDVLKAIEEGQAKLEKEKMRLAKLLG
jgi:gas vesicle protein